jgi:hypothetical protein
VSADDKKIPEPHPLPLTRQWVEDYKRYGTDPKPEAADVPVPEGPPEPTYPDKGPDDQIERMYAAQGGRLGCEMPPLVVRDGKFVPYGVDPLSTPLDAPGCPDLQALVERAGRRHAESIGEKYVEDPFKRPPHQGGYPHITREEWAAYDAAMAEWQARRRL